MIRSAVAVLAFVALPTLVASPATAQEPQQAAAAEVRTHEVQRGETLWAIALRYYDDARRWRDILEANRDRIDDPDDIDVGLVLRVPRAGGAAAVGAVTVTTAERGGVAEEAREAVDELEEAAGELEDAARAAQEARGPKPVERRTVMYPEAGEGTLEADPSAMLAAVAPDVAFSAPWLDTGDVERRALGEIAGFTGLEGNVSPRTSVRPHDRLLVTFSGTTPPVGSLLQVVRESRVVPGVGRVMTPTGVVRIESTEPAGAVAVAEKLYSRMELGDELVALPEYTLEAEERPTVVADGPEAGIIAFARDRPIHSIGDVLFLDRGAEDGVRVGDEYVVEYSSGEGWSGVVESRLQVVSVQPRHASARITAEESPIFARGIRVRLERRMR